MNDLRAVGLVRADAALRSSAVPPAEIDAAEEPATRIVPAPGAVASAWRISAVAVESAAADRVADRAAHVGRAGERRDFFGVAGARVGVERRVAEDGRRDDDNGGERNHLL